MSGLVGGRAGAMVVWCATLAAATSGLPQRTDAQSGSQKAPAVAMVRLGGGTFTMGSTTGPADERPTHRVDIKPFALDIRPVSNAEFAAFLDTLGGGVANARGQRLFDDDDNDARIHKHAGHWRADAGWETRPAIEMSWAVSKLNCNSRLFD